MCFLFFKEEVQIVIYRLEYARNDSPKKISAQKFSFENLF